MSEKTIEDRIRMVLTREAMVAVDPRSIGDETLLIDELGLDSIQIVELMSGLEDEFGISMEDEDLSLEVFASVKALAAFVRGKLGN